MEKFEGGEKKTTSQEDIFNIIQKRPMIEFRCVVTVSTPAVWLARENIKRLTPRPCINVEYSHRVVYIEEESGREARRALPQIRSSTIQYPDHIYTKPL